MKIIEFLGAPGVGKTTLYKELIRKRQKPYKFLTPKEVKFEIVRKYLTNNKKIPYSFLKKIILHNKVFYKFHFYLIEKILNNPELKPELLINKREENIIKELIEINTESNFSVEIKLLRFSWLLDILKEIKLFEKFNSNYNVIFDEGISQKISSISYYNKERIKDLSFINLINKSIIIYLELDKNIIFKRLINRRKEKNTFLHKKLDDKKIKDDIIKRIEFNKFFIQNIKKEGIKIIKIDSSMDILKQIKIIEKYL